MKTHKILLRVIQTSYFTIFLLISLIGQWGIYSSPVSAEEDVFEALEATYFEKRVKPFDFSLPSVNGGEQKLSDLKGKVVFLNFWATWCPYCRLERSTLQALYDHYKEREFVVVSVSLDRTSIDTVKKYVGEHEITFPNLHDQTLEVALKYSIRGIPATFFLDKKGDIAGRVIGPRTWDDKDTQALVEQLLAETD